MRQKEVILEVGRELQGDWVARVVGFGVLCET